LAVALPNENLKKILSVGRQLTAAEGRVRTKKKQQNQSNVNELKLAITFF